MRHLCIGWNDQPRVAEPTLLERFDDPLSRLLIASDGVDASWLVLTRIASIHQCQAEAGRVQCPSIAAISWMPPERFAMSRSSIERRTTLRKIGPANLLCGQRIQSQSSGCWIRGFTRRLNARSQEDRAAGDVHSRGKKDRALQRRPHRPKR